METKQVLEALRWRYATKKFDARRTIPAEVWSALEESLVLAPSSFGLQPWKFWVVTDAALRQALVPHSWMQTQPVDCSHFVVFAVKTGIGEADVDRLISRSVEVRGGTREALGGYRSMMLGSLADAAKRGTLDSWMTHQVYIALGQFMLAAAMVGVDTCPMEGLVPAEYDRILGLAGTGCKTVVACAAGYRSADDRYARLAKVRFPAGEVIVKK